MRENTGISLLFTEVPCNSNKAHFSVTPFCSPPAPIPIYIWTLSPLQMGCRGGSFISLRKKDSGGKSERFETWTKGRGENKRKIKSQTSVELIHHSQKIKGAAASLQPSLHLLLNQPPLISFQQRLRWNVQIYLPSEFRRVWCSWLTRVPVEGNNRKRRQHPGSRWVSFESGITV